MKLPNRLQCIADMITNCTNLADIGTDHAFLPIYLLSENKIEFAVAADINAGPLAIARQNVESHGKLNQVRLCLSDGFENIEENEVDTAVIAGMGGELIARIMTDAPNSVKTFIVQPMSHIYEFRRLIQKSGFKITEEQLVAEGKKIYNVLKIVRGVQNWSDKDLRISPLLKNSPLFKEYIHRNLTRINTSLESLKNSDDKTVTDDFLKLQAEYMSEL